MSTKGQQILDPWSAWNAAPNDEPVLVLRAEDWRLAMLIALNTDDKGGRMSLQQLFDAVIEMKKYSDDNTIPF